MKEIKKRNTNELYYDTKNELEIIKKYQELILYVYNLLKKYPDDEKMNLANDTKKSLIDGLEKLVSAKKTYYKGDKLKYLMSAEAKLKTLKILVRIAVKNKFINKKNYTAWSYKIVEINDMLEKWIRSCQR